MSDINQWAAEQCEIYQAETYWTPKDRKSNHKGMWTLDDARCREIVREHFRITTDQYGGDWASFPRGSAGLAIETRGNGKTIAEAEINCIKAIRVAQE